MNKRFRSALTGILFGGFYGGIIGAILLGLSAYFDNTSSSLLGSPRNWLGIYTIFGAICGLVIGSILGAIIGALQADRRTSITIGIVIGLLIVTGLFYDTFALVIVLSCSILGLIISSRLQARKWL